jgi:hypothetical protein
MRLARKPWVGQERGIYPAGTPARQIGAWKDFLEAHPVLRNALLKGR